MGKKKTHNEFLEDLEKVHPNKFIILSEYAGGSNKIYVECKSCEYNFYPRPGNLLQGSGCPKCSLKEVAKLLKKSHEDFLLDLEKIHSNKFKVLGEYINTNTKLNFKHKLCKYIFSSTPASLLRGHGCPKCANNIKISNEEFEEFLLEKIDIDNIILLSDYVNFDLKLIFKCKICLNTFKETPYKLINRKHSCLKCGLEKMKNKQRKSHEDFLLDLEKIHSNKFEVLNEYVNSDTKINFLCKICSYNFYSNPSNILQGSSCPKCSKSYGIKENQWLDSLNKPNLIRQHRITIKYKNGKKKLYIVDGFDRDTNVCYEFYGDFWHGNPEIYGMGSRKKNSANGKTFNQL